MAQTIFPIAPVQIADPAVNYNWAIIDLSPWIPPGATGAVVYIHNPGGAGVREWGVRKNGSADNRFLSMSDLSHCWGIVGVDANLRLQFKNLTANPNKCGMYLVGYTMPGVTMFTNGVAIAPAGFLAWQPIDLSAQVPVGTVGVIIEVITDPGGATSYGFRMNGSADNRTNTGLNWKNQFTAIIGCDANRIIEAYRGAAGIFFYLLGYITDGVTFYLNAVNMTPAGVGAWQLCPNVVPALGVMAFIEMAAVAGNQSVRKNPGGWGPLQHASLHPWAVVECDVLGQVEGYKGNAGDGFWMTGYASKLAVLPTETTDPATGIGIASSTLNGTLVDDGGEACTCGFQWGLTNAYGNTTPTESKTTGEHFSQLIVGLAPHKTYHFRAFATNSAGTSYGAHMTFITLGIVVPTVTTDPVTTLGVWQATLNGTPVDDGGEACDCGFEWGKPGAYGTTTPTQSKTTGLAFSQTIAPLEPGTEYHYRAFARNSAGTAYGADVSFRTYPAPSRGYALSREEL